MAIDLKRLLSSEKFVPVYAIRKGLDGERLGPFSVELHWTSACNHGCTHCSYGLRRVTRERLSDAEIINLIRDIASLGTKAVYLSGGGEPTLVNGWHRYASLLMDAGIEVALITNGSLLKQGHRTVLRRMNYIAISVYSTDKERYERITGGSAFDKQFSLPSWIKDGGSRAVVGARCVLNSINFMDTVSIYREAQNAGYDYVIFIPAVDYEKRGVGLKEAETAELKGILGAHSGEFDRARTNINTLFGQGMSYYETSDYRSPSGFDSCKAIQVRANAFVNYDGAVYTCQPHIGREGYSLGNIKHGPFARLWNSKRHREVLCLLNHEFSSGLCKNCRSIAFNKAVYSHEQNPTDEGLLLDVFI
ncbi:MAG: radical SAM protein [Deltaproteobacteria bacterium]|nr:radical SAM protein [Deltaproteobacteria bacterium]